MLVNVRALHAEDNEQVRRVSNSVWEDDYIANNFLSWIDDPSWHFVGVFEDDDLVSFTALQEVPGAIFGWIKGLRTDIDRQRKGYGSLAVRRALEIAKGIGLHEIRYVTGSRNEASLQLALKLGFEVFEKVMSFRLTKPFPPRPKPSPSIVPLNADAARVYEAVQRFPDLMGTQTIPFPYEFEEKTREGFERVGRKVDFKLIISDSGEALSLFYIRDFENDGTVNRRATLFARDRSAFVDTISRIIEDTERDGIESLGFLLGPNASDWVSSMMLLSEEYMNRSLILLTLKL
ncbi:MAG: GNAT family N-acetyltransferase [Candidatus Thorarchaeota archaeon]